MAASLAPEDRQTFQRLFDELNAANPRLQLLDRYYDGAQRLAQLGLAIPEGVLPFTVIVNWPRIAVDARTERMEVKGFTLPGSDAIDADLWALWQSNDMDEQDMLARLDFEVYARSYLCVGSPDSRDGDPIITAESPRQVIVQADARTRERVAALRLYDEGEDGSPRRATLYKPNETLWMMRDGGDWAVTDRDQHGLGVVPVVPSYRSRRSAIPAHRSPAIQGSSIIGDIAPIVDSASRNITNVQVAQETHAVPARYALGVSKGDFIDASGNPIPAWEARMGAIWSLSSKDAKAGQFDASSMENFERMHNMYARTASGIAGLPPNYFGLSADDAASADAIRSREARLVRSIELDEMTLGNGREEAMRIAMRIKSGKWDSDLDQMECKWHDAGTPTYASRVDAVVKQFAVTDAGGRPLISRRSALEELGWSPQRINRELQRLDDERPTDPTLENLARTLDRTAPVEA